MRAIVLAFAAALGIAACDLADAEKIEAAKFDRMDFRPGERAIAEALVDGFKREVGREILRGRDYAHAACYARTVEMPTRFSRVHARYLENYAEIDADYYPWFAARGYDEQAAYEFGNIVVDAFEECEIGSLLRKAFAR